VDAAFRALAEPRRREILHHVWSRELAASEIAGFFKDVTRSAISQHLSVLRQADLVTERREGVRRLYRANHLEMDRLRRHLEKYWGESLDRLRILAETAEHEKGTIDG
jgi:DNA-binding transcriptional ArsR family regulator